MNELQTADQITNTLSSWIRAETVVSNTDRNSYLDRLEDQRNRMVRSTDGNGNYFHEKLRSHLQRIAPWFEAFSYDPSDDYQTAKMIFSPLMLLSGCYRETYIFQATDQTDYYARKRSLEGLEEEVHHVVEARLGSQESKILDLSQLKKASRLCIEAAQTEGLVAIERATSGEDFGIDDSPAIESTRTRIHNWTGFATDLIMYARQIRAGELEAVPFLEAKSISDEPQVYYPFAA